MPDLHTLSQLSEVIVCYFHDQKHDVVKTDSVRWPNSLLYFGPSCLSPTPLFGGVENNVTNGILESTL